jgi:1-acyl-sn-glycerol-3-phosphate acyltransferase
VSVLRSLIFYAVFYAGTVIIVSTSLLAAVFLPAEQFRKVPNSWSRFHILCMRYILGIVIREEGVRPEGQALYALKHESYYDAIDLGRLLDNPVPFAKEELFRIPGWGRVARIYGVIPVMRDAGAKGLRVMMTEARKFIGTERPLAIFPEGTSIPHGARPPLRAGFAGLYKLLGVPVVPVAIDSGPLYHRWWKRPGTITVRFCEPIPPGLPREEIEARVHAAINELNG